MPFSTGTCPGTIGEDAEDPCLQCGACFEAAKALYDAQPCLLRHILCHSPIADQAPGEAYHCRVKAVEDDCEGAFISPAQGFQQSRLVKGSASTCRIRRPRLYHSRMHRATCRFRWAALSGCA